jgi:ParB-like chromosome segregation protein Spo0J
VSRAVHPVADLFPMLPDDELAELAESIEARGLDHPIVLDPEGRVLDGRNRLKACEIAGVEPRFETYDGDDGDDYALRNGINRRHQTTGSLAMIAAKAARMNGKRQKDVAQDHGISNLRISDATVVLDWCDATTVNSVITGDTPLSKAVETARRLKKEDADREAKKASLRSGAPDLLARVSEGMDLDEAMAALKARQDKAAAEERDRAAKLSAQQAAERAARQEALNAWNQASDHLTAVLSHVKTYPPPANTDIYATVADFQRRAAELQQITQKWEDVDGDK